MTVFRPLLLPCFSAHDPDSFKVHPHGIGFDVKLHSRCSEEGALTFYVGILSPAENQRGPP